MLENIAEGDLGDVKETVRQRLWYAFEEVAEWNPLWVSLQVTTAAPHNHDAPSPSNTRPERGLALACAYAPPPPRSLTAAVSRERPSCGTTPLSTPTAMRLPCTRRPPSSLLRVLRMRVCCVCAAWLCR